MSSFPTEIGHCCSTDQILKISFSSLTFIQKSEIIKAGRSTVHLNLHTAKKTYVRHFHNNLYDKYSFLTGSCQLNKLYCWPCMLFATDKSAWNYSGISDLNNLTNSVVKHVTTEKHLHSIVNLESFGKTRIEFAVDKQQKAIARVHNEKVDRNLNIMRRLIDTTIFLGKQELSFRAHDESESSNNRGNFIESLQFLSSYDSVIEGHFNSLKSSCAFSGLSGEIQNDLISSISSVIISEIKAEIAEASFVSIMIDETPDISRREQLTTILRYVSNNSVEERFLGYVDVSSERTAIVLSSHVFSILEKFNCSEKLVAQSYDGAAVMSSELNGVQSKVREKCSMAIFVPCHAHILNLVLSRSVENVAECKKFFGHINKLVSFFNTSTKRSALLNEIMDRRLPSVASTRWHYHSRILNVIHDNRSDFITTFETIQNNSSKWDEDSLTFADAYDSKFKEFEFNFYLGIFSEIYARTDILFKIIQSRTVNISYSIKKINEFKKWLETDFQNSFSNLYNKYKNLCEPPKKRRRNELNDEQYFKIIFKEVCDNILMQMNDRFVSFEKLNFLELLEPTLFKLFKRKFPDKLFESLKNSYSGIFDSSQLKNELKVIYSLPEFQDSNLRELFEYFKNKKCLVEAFSQTYKLVKLFLTLPTTTATAERSFSTLKRVHTYCRNTQNQTRLSNLSIIAIEKELLIKLKRGQTFYDDVLKKFLQKNRRIDLEYK
jgi:hypothetical protein